jgi:hypothetical protein
MRIFFGRLFSAFYVLEAVCDLLMNVKSTDARENSDGSVGRESAAPPAGPSLRRRSRLYYSTAFESCGALRREKDRREALRFPALRGAPTVGDLLWERGASAPQRR